MTVTDESGNELGTISDLLVTLDDTRIRTVVLESNGGFFGIGEESTRRHANRCRAL